MGTPPWALPGRTVEARMSVHGKTGWHRVTLAECPPSLASAFAVTSEGRVVPLRRVRPLPPHDCHSSAVPVETEGPLGHGWSCGLCGAFLQAG